MGKKSRPKRHLTYEEWARQSARKMEGNAPRKHHVVPGSYLRRWENDGGLWITDRVDRRTFRSAADKIARETDFYRLDAREVSVGTPPLIAEFELSQIEDSAVGPIDRLVSSPGLVEGYGRDRFDTAVFIAVQALRGRRVRLGHRNSMAALNRLISTAGLNADAIRARHDGDLSAEDAATMVELSRQISAGEIELIPTQAASIELIFEMLEDFGWWIFDRTWIVYQCDDLLVTTDEPVVALGGRLIERGSIPGPATAGVMMIALDPHHLLAMFHPDIPIAEQKQLSTLTRTEVREINLELAAHAHRHIVSFGGFAAPPTLPSLPPPVALSTVEKPVPILNSDEGAGIVQLFQPSPWLYIPSQKLPVDRWWQLDERRYGWKRKDAPWMPRSGVVVNDRR